MKKRTNNLFIIGLTVLGMTLFCGCQKDIVFDHEMSQFELRSNAILIELVAPVGTSVDDEIYIFGAFNGLDEKTALTHLEWKLEKAQNSDKKWGIYLFPKDFVAGKTLKDGFSFVSKKAGGERDIKGQTVSHTSDVAVGSRVNIWAERWASYFSGGGDKVQHNGYVVYVLDESGYADLHLYMYGDVNDLNGAWPGMAPTGKETVNGTEYTYFDIGEDNNGLTETLIFNDNGAVQLKDYGPVTLNDNIFLHIYPDGTIEKISSSSTVEHDGAVVYVLDGIGWGMSTTLYMWGDVNNLNGGWPGMTVGGTAEIGEYTYLYYDMGAANDGLAEHLIFSNNGASQLKDYDDYVIGEDIYFYITLDGVTVIDDPENPGDVEWFNPTAAPKEEASLDLYFYNAADTLAPLYIYAWGASEVFGAWPGTSFAAMDSLAILGLPLLHTTLNGYVNDEWHLIVNNNTYQLEDYTVRAEQVSGELYLKVTDSIVSPLQITAQSRRK